ncbi:uncharacterized protein LOC107766243 isoform X1 [Nicotiana tabacum]|uniref:Uncharacterized protein LOC107766243 isoform X1 n=1 Tax=Nicotiana tabacum TaxID=4097 RepID=A0AC58TJE5_TOBAC
MFVLLPRFQQKLRITQKMAANNDFIKDITISKMQWKLKVRVVRMWEKPDRFNPGSIFSIELVLQDEKGDHIHASIGKSVLHIFNKKINELGLYLMANFIVCQNKERFNTTKHRLMLTFTQRTTVAETIDPLFPMNIFELRPYHQLINKGDVNESELFDVIGEIVNFSEVQTQKQGEITRKYMDIELEDDERNKLSATFWEEFVDQVIPHLLSSNNQPIIVVMQLIKAHKFQDELQKGIAEVKTIAQLVQSMQVSSLFLSSFFDFSEDHLFYLFSSDI